MDGSIADLTITELCMLCDVHLIFLGDNNFRVLMCRQCIQSPITATSTQDANDTTDQNQTLAKTDTAVANMPPSTVVGILSDDLNTGTVVTLTSSPAAAEIEAAKCLLALKREKNTATTQSETTSDRTTKSITTQPTTDDTNTAALPSKQPSDKEIVKTKLNRIMLHPKQTTSHDMWKQLQWKRSKQQQPLMKQPSLQLPPTTKHQEVLSFSHYPPVQ